MAKEAGLKVSDMAEIACYNLIAIYEKQHGTVDPDGEQTMQSSESVSNNTPSV